MASTYHTVVAACGIMKYLVQGHGQPNIFKETPNNYNLAMFYLAIQKAAKVEQGKLDNILAPVAEEEGDGEDGELA